MKHRLFYVTLFLLTGLLTFSVMAQNQINFPEIGKLKTLSSKEIKSSMWSIGGEVQDRDYTDYQAYKSYLGPLGAKRIRLQAGWAKCEKTKGVYDFTWLDTVINDVIAQGISPWVECSYGNPIYEGGGQKVLAGGIPTSEEALKAWDNWVNALVTRYKDRVKEWEIWNEPDISKKMTADEFAVFHVRTCTVIKKVQPDSRIVALGINRPDFTHYVLAVVNALKAENKLNYLDIIAYHGYYPIPEGVYPDVKRLRGVLDSCKAGIDLWQGENGAPSTPKGQSVGALTSDDWSEITQAKWVLRRMMGDLSHDLDVCNIFTIADYYYASGDHMVGYNSKGLLKADSLKRILRPKPSYFAYQHVATIFSEKIVRIKSAQITTNDSTLSVFAFNKENLSGSAIIFHFPKNKPIDNFTAKMRSFSVTNIKMKNPVLIDLYSGKIHQLPKENYVLERNGVRFKNIPVVDYPIVIADKEWIKVTK